MASSNVGSAQIYEGNEQKAVEEQPDRFHEGKPHAHNHLDSKDERTIANKLAREEQRDQEGSEDSIETQQLKQDATLPAKAHGNKPSRGAEIDQELKEEEEAILKKKGAFGPAASN